MDSPQLNSVRLFCCLFQLCNETVSMGDTAVSLHILGEGVFLVTQNSKSQVLTKFSFFRILGKMSQKFCKRKLGLAPQIVSFTLVYVWRLKSH